MNSSPFENLASLLAGHPNAAALRDDQQALGREQLLAASGHAARALHQLGLRRGDAFAVWLPNGAAWLQLLFAAAHLGLLVVPVSTRPKSAICSRCHGRACWSTPASFWAKTARLWHWRCWLRRRRLSS